jgi:hypothetical protein
MKRVFRIDVLTCAKCGSERRWIVAITNADAIAKIQDHLDLPSVMIQLAPPRAPSQLELGFEGGARKAECEGVTGRLWD